MLFVGFAWDFFKRPLTYEVPANYHGWVIIQYGDANCSPEDEAGHTGVLVRLHLYEYRSVGRVLSYEV